MVQFGVCDMEQFGRLQSSEKTIAIIGDRWCRRRRDRKRIG